MLGLLVAATWTAAGPAAGLAAYKDPSQPIATRVEDLLGRMTLAEKAAQLGCENPLILVFRVCCSGPGRPHHRHYALGYT